jgi:hypothetical protein
MIKRELVTEFLLFPLPANTCFSPDPQICEFARRKSRQSSCSGPLQDCVILKPLALIPAIITYGLGMRFTRSKEMNASYQLAEAY